MKYVVNCRFISQKTTGVQRFAHESCLNTLDILGSNVEFVCPRGKFKNELDSKLMIKEIGIFKGHLWEQIDLPLYCFFKKGFLFLFVAFHQFFSRIQYIQFMILLILGSQNSLISFTDGYIK